jgi:hypothetical protein
MMLILLLQLTVPNANLDKPTVSTTYNMWHWHHA